MHPVKICTVELGPNLSSDLVFVCKDLNFARDGKAGYKFSLGSSEQMVLKEMQG